MASRSPAPLPLMIDPIQMIDRHPVPAVLITVVALAALVPVGFLARRILRAVARLRARTLGGEPGNRPAACTVVAWSPRPWG